MASQSRVYTCFLLLLLGIYGEDDTEISAKIHLVNNACNLPAQCKALATRWQNKLEYNGQSSCVLQTVSPELMLIKLSEDDFEATKSFILEQPEVTKLVHKATTLYAPSPAGEERKAADLVAVRKKQREFNLEKERKKKEAAAARMKNQAGEL